MEGNLGWACVGPDCSTTTGGGAADFEQPAAASRTTSTKRVRKDELMPMNLQKRGVVGKAPEVGCACFWSTTPLVSAVKLGDHGSAVHKPALPTQVPKARREPWKVRRVESILLECAGRGLL